MECRNRTDLENFENAKRVWGGVSVTGTLSTVNMDLESYKRLLSFAHIGKFYFYLFDVFNAKFTHVSNEINEVLGYEPNQVTAEFFLSKIHPDDMHNFLNYEAAVVDFFKNLPDEKLTKYKIMYDYRVANSDGKYVRILHQVMTYEVDYGKTLISLGLHTDISHIKRDNKQSLSLIGLDGEPSYYDYTVAQIYKPKSIFTKREQEVLDFLLQGESIDSIATKLVLSASTVNSHRRNILDKTFCKNNIELAVKVVSEGLL